MKLFRRTRQTVPGRNPAGLRPRNRPLRDPQPSGSGQGGIHRTFSYYAARSQMDVNTGREATQSRPPVRRLPTRLQRLRGHAGWLAGGALVLVLTVYQLQLSTDPRVVALTSGSDTPFLQATGIYGQAARKLFDASAGNRNKLTVNANDIARQLRVQFPELQEVVVTLPVIGDRPTVYVRPADPVLVLAASNGTFIIDANGRALARATAGMNFGRFNVPMVTDQSNIQAELGRQVLPRSATLFIGTVNRQLKARNIAVRSMTLPAATGELNAYITGKPYYVRFNLQSAGQGQAELQAGTFIAVSKQLEGQGVTPSQYVDVRLEGRAYYK